MSKSPTITEVGPPADWLDNPTAGEILSEEFLKPLSLTAEELARQIGVAEDRITNVLEAKSPVDADLDLRLGRYFGMSEGFFLRLQNAHELLAAKRAHAAELDQIVRRAA